MIKLRLYGHGARLDSETGISIAMDLASGNRFSHDRQHASVSCGTRETSRDPGGEYSRGKVPNAVAFSSEIWFDGLGRRFGNKLLSADILIEEKRSEKLSRGSLDGPIVGLTRDEFRGCLVESGKSRMLPICLTKSMTIGGLMPLAFAGGPFGTGLAWTTIFGIAVATVLTLIVVPAIYAILVETFGLQPIQVEQSVSQVEQC